MSFDNLDENKMENVEQNDTEASRFAEDLNENDDMTENAPDEQSEASQPVQYGKYYGADYSEGLNGYSQYSDYGFYGDTGNSEKYTNEKKRGKRTGLVILGIALGAVMLFSGALAGSFAYNYFREGRKAEFSADDTRDIPENSVKLEITEIKPDENDGDVPESGQVLTVEQIAEKVTPSVVGVVTESYSNFNESGTGSGIIMSADGYIITNYHVISGSDRITVVLDNGDDYTASTIGYDAKTDIAVLKIEARDLPAAEFGDSDALKQGSLAVAIGNPLGIQLQGTVTQGCISAINRNVSVDNKIMTLIQTDASINPGNSGGPLVNKYGQVIGINSVKLGISYYEGLGFAIPINTAKPIVDELIAFGYIKGRPAIGITGRNITERAANFYGVPQGILVDSVTRGSDAYAKGIKTGDIITSVNGQRVLEMQEISEIKDKLSAGDEISVTVYRNGKVLDIKFKLMDEATLYGYESD